MTAEPVTPHVPTSTSEITVAPGARVVTYRCHAHQVFRVLWPEVETPLVHPCPTCARASLRLIDTRPDAA